MTSTRTSVLLFVGFALAASFGGCSCDDGEEDDNGGGAAGGGTTTMTGGSGGNGAAAAGGGGSASTGGGNTGGSTVTPPTTIAECQGHVYQCGDLIDNDSDGLLDTVDPDCLGPCDNTEDSYYGGIPG
ncbi:MAG: hypothetical protein HOW73_46200, partial [Polyangiaceae bacterium]|nr:hypothetical protein [Polyangiaceae bacterium]